RSQEGFDGLICSLCNKLWSQLLESEKSIAGVIAVNQLPEVGAQAGMLGCDSVPWDYRVGVEVSPEFFIKNFPFSAADGGEGFCAGEEYDETGQKGGCDPCPFGIKNSGYHWIPAFIGD